MLYVYEVMMSLRWSSSCEIRGDSPPALSICGWASIILIIITSSLGRVLRGGVNAQRVKALLGDVEHFGVHRDNRVCTGSVRWGKTGASSALVWMENAPERAALSTVVLDCLCQICRL